MPQQTLLSSRIRNIPVWVLTFILFSVTYGLFGDPTPTTLNFITLLWLGFFLFSLSWQQFVRLGSLPRIELYGVGVFVLSLVYPLVVGTLSGHDPFLMLRDISSYLILFIGFFFLPYFEKYKHRTVKVLLYGILIVAFTMALRRLGILPYGIERSSVFNDPFALSVIPEILFGSVFLVSFSVLNFLNVEKRTSVQIFTFMGLALCVVPLLALMNMSVMRAGLGVVFIAGVVSWFIVAMNRPLASLGLIAVMVAIVAMFMKPLTAIFQLFWMKTVMIGTNNRLLELNEVLKNIMNDPVSFLFGRGWGVVLSNPAVGGEQVLYTHSLLSSSLLKGGFVLMGIVGIYLLWLFTRIFKELLSEKRPFYIALYLAILLTFLVNTLLYGGYKTIGFGLVLALAMGMASCYGQYSQKNDKQPLLKGR